MTFKVVSVVPVWIVTIAGSVLVGLFSPEDEYFTWLPIVFATATLLTFCIQVFVRSKDDLVLKMMASLGGSVLILGVATGILGLTSA